MAKIDPYNLKWPDHLVVLIPFLLVFVCIFIDLARHKSEKYLTDDEKFNRHGIGYICGFIIFVAAAIPLLIDLISQHKSALHYGELVLLAIYIGIATWVITHGSFSILAMNIFCIVMLFVGIESDQEGLLGWDTLIHAVFERRIVWLSWVIFSLSTIGAVVCIVNWFRGIASEAKG